ncbi:serine hydrolase [Pontixanthobacter aestiaquae]|uniref:Serine hydrolase n=1 Tax=Pontixanthobacter aestiaquae TaxID=1509367 RepID=A0A844Z6Y2_9SPHN|nr:serine hydrolase [Pontixanthobacter aestiaquae]MDN3645442.1 serine hydrolase [Pontixanthobacter aestiaquae]MXO83558.1 serine hydrolase [Pontixanthobacter aestiaquae]
MISRLATSYAPICLALSIPAVATPATAWAQKAEQSPLELRADDTAALIQGTKEPENIFAPIMLAAVPPAQFKAISEQLIAQHGALQGVESVTPLDATSGTAVLRFAKALVTVTLSLEQAEPNLINGLRITNVETLNDSMEKIKADLDALPGEVGVLFSKLDESSFPALARNAGTQYAIGSTFKLYILSALARSIEAGERKWSDVVELDRQSFPSGRMQNWPKGAPVTLQTLATMMITISDNTATDMLLYEVGRDAVEAELIASGHSDPDRTLPFLSTLQMFALKGSPGNLAKYVAADETTQRMILADFEDDVGGDPDKVTPPRFTSPTAIDTVEWFASGQDLQKLLRRIVDLSDPTARNIMGISPALPGPVTEKWAYVGYKGGSEPGVLNLTWLLQDKVGGWHVLSLSWNNTEANVDNAALDGLAQRILAFSD